MLGTVSYQLSTENRTELYIIGMNTQLEETSIADCPSGKLDVMYFQSEIYQTRDYKMPVPSNLNGIEQEYCAYPLQMVFQWNLKLLVLKIKMENGFNYPPNTVKEATELFIQITDYIDRL